MSINIFSARNAEMVYRKVVDSINNPIFQATEMERMESRNGFAVRMDSTSIIEFQRPQECVIFDPIRNCNPFLHLAEAMWMLAGRNDLDFITKFTPSMSAYSDDGVTLHSAYGHRWRNHFGIDQLKDVIDNLRKDTVSRRELVVMWDPRSDLHAKNNGGKDLSCNFAMKFGVRKGRLNLTVYNRSNDSIFGCPGGANSVHFAYVLMFVATCTGLPVGTYTQVADDLHIYGGDVYRGLAKTLLFEEEGQLRVRTQGGTDRYASDVRPFCMATSSVFGADNFESLSNEIEVLVASCGTDPHVLSNPFLRNIARPMIVAYLEFFKGKNDPSGAREYLLSIPQPYKEVDWIVSGIEWLTRIIDARAASGKA